MFQHETGRLMEGALRRDDCRFTRSALVFFISTKARKRSVQGPMFTDIYFVVLVHRIPSYCGVVYFRNTLYIYLIFQIDQALLIVHILHKLVLTTNR